MTTRWTAIANVIATHLIVERCLSSKVMNEEIFGPLLPLITYRNIEEAFQIINSNQGLWRCI
ncbi:aldehyde dehydrogenase family protein [Vibrio lentus]|nr:aldehyde dehydrogenase family protein [Vibrio lentus]